MRPAAKFPFGSVRQAVAALGDAWGLAFDPMPHELERYNEVFRAERHDADVMKRCSMTMDRGTAFDPRVWIGVASTERPA